LIELSYDNQSVNAPTLPDARLNPALLVALLQLALWPADAVRAGLGAPLTLEETPTGRRILSRDEPLLTIDHGGDPAHRRMRLTMPGAGLELAIETLDATPTETAP
jgi:hypothetical protein